MDILLLPDFFAMGTLLGVLAVVRRRYPQHDIRLWMGGLLLILLESAARVFYGMHLPALWHQMSHVVALDAYLVAGVFFLRSSLEHLRRMPRSALYIFLNTVPAVALMTFYGFDVRSDALYVCVAAAGGVTAVLTTTTLYRSRLHLFALLGIWLPVMGSALAHAPRWMVYLHLSLLYLLAAVTFWKTLPRRSSGKITVVMGFAMWSLCFVTHPWVAHTHWSALASEIWNLQKFLITIGFLLVLFEKQVQNNEWLALHDQLTGLPNRRLFEDRIGNAFARAERNRTAMILFAMDLNDFKEVNDTLGHDAGDALLRSVSSSLQGVVRRSDTLARLGGDEFALLAVDVKEESLSRRERRWLCSQQDGTDVAVEVFDVAKTMNASETSTLRHVGRIENAIRRAINQPVLLPHPGGSKSVEISVSIGIAIYPNDGTDLAELTRTADRRMYEDKHRQKEERAGLDGMLSLLGSQMAAAQRSDTIFS